MNDLIGYSAAFCTTLAFVPQAWLTWKTRSTHGVSLGMYSMAGNQQHKKKYG